MSNSLSLPMSVEAVTTTWLNQAIKQRHPTVDVIASSVIKVIWGSATKVQMELTYNDAGKALGLPTIVYVKGGFDPELLQMVGSGYVTEAIFYKVIAPQLDIPLPATYFSGYDTATNQAIVLMEDLDKRGVAFGIPTIAYTPEQVAQGLDVQARWHARWWNNTELVEQGWLRKGNPGLRHVMHQLLTPEHWDKHLSLPKANPVAGDLRKRDVVVRSFERLWAYDDAAAQCFLHGDTHIGNTYREANGAVRFLDWQTVMLGPWSHDAAIFIAGSLAPQDRRTHEKELLEQYLGRLRDLGVDAPSFNAAWTDYVRHILHGFLWVMTPEEMQPNAYTAAMTERYSVAADELGTLHALR
ncbi:MAG: phosphotransferase [Spongiibacteraceae bacterium]